MECSIEKTINNFKFNQLKHNSNFWDNSVENMSLFDRSKTSNKKDKPFKKLNLSYDNNEIKGFQNLQKKLTFKYEKKSNDIIEILES